MTFRFPLYIAVIPALIALVPIIPGILLAQRPTLRMLGLVLIGVGAIFAFVFGPMLFLDHVVVDDSGVRQRTGFWFAPTRKGFEFSEVAAIRVERTLTRRGVVNPIWHVQRVDGRTLQLDPGDLWEAHRDEIQREIRARGIRVSP